MFLKRFVPVMCALALGAGGASAAEKATKPKPRVAAPYDWSGLYVGADLGGAWSKADAARRPFALPQAGSQSGGGAVPGDRSPTFESGAGGVHAGYNVQSGNVVYGGEADISGMSRRENPLPLR